MNTEKAIKHFEGEIRFCERAPAGNPVHMTEDWTMILEANRAALAALREKQERENPKPLTEDDLRQMMGEPVWCVYEGGANWFFAQASLFTILNGLTAYRYKPGDFGEVNKITLPTNADRIRAMSDEEMAAILYDDAAVDDKLHFCQNRQECMDAIDRGELIPDEKCMGCLLEWLRMPAGEVCK